MVIKKKSTKQSKSNRGRFTGRGRPRKEFKPKHKRIQEQGQTTTTLVEHKMPSHERILRMPNKDKSIFYLFIFSIVLFLCSLTISFVKKQNVEELQAIQEGATTVVTETPIAEPIITEPVETQTAGTVEQVVENMYGTINARSFDEFNNYLDDNLKYSNTIRTYFNTKRLERFLSNIKDEAIIISNLRQEQLKDYSRKVEYILSYALLDGQAFEEERNVTVVKRNDEYSVATIKCETAGCSRMPFFNPGKYNIK